MVDILLPLTHPLQGSQSRRGPGQVGPETTGGHRKPTFVACLSGRRPPTLRLVRTLIKDLTTLSPAPQTPHVLISFGESGAGH